MAPVGLPLPSVMQVPWMSSGVPEPPYTTCSLSHLISSHPIPSHPHPHPHPISSFIPTSLQKKRPWTMAPLVAGEQGVMGRIYE